MTVSNSVVTAPTNGHIYAVLGNTQTVSQTLAKFDLGTSDVSHVAVNIHSTRAIGNDSGMLHIRMRASATQQTGNMVPYGISMGTNWNTNSPINTSHIYMRNEQNAGSGFNSGIYIDNYSTDGLN